MTKPSRGGTRRDSRLTELAEEYHARTEAYDRSICTGPIAHGVVRLFTFLFALGVLLVNLALYLVVLLVLAGLATLAWQKINWHEFLCAVGAGCFGIAIFACYFAGGWAWSRVFRSRKSNPTGQATVHKSEEHT